MAQAAELIVSSLLFGSVFFTAGGLMLWRIQKILETAERLFTEDIEEEDEVPDLVDKSKEE
jgi:hypothetical protein